MAARLDHEGVVWLAGWLGSHILTGFDRETTDFRPENDRFPPIRARFHPHCAYGRAW
jgi:hypothetical protein